MPELIAAHDAFMQEHRRCLTYYNGTQISGETDEEAEEREARRRETVYSGRDQRSLSRYISFKSELLARMVVPRT
jgi:hypothetical protein